MSDVTVVGDRMEMPISDFERACLVHISDEQAKPLPDTSLIAVLCHAVRCARDLSAASGGSANLLSPEHDAAFNALPADQQVVRLKQAVDYLARRCANVEGRLRNTLAAGRSLRIDANRLCDRCLGGTYEDDCRASIERWDRTVAL